MMGARMAYTGLGAINGAFWSSDRFAQAFWRFAQGACGRCVMDVWEVTL